jgi:hypothetical protein
MVGDKIEDQLDVPFGEHAAGFCQTFRTAKMRFNDVVAHAVRRADVVFR